MSPRSRARIAASVRVPSGLPGVSTSLFVLGHILGAILMGLALRGSIATVGWAMLLTTPVHVVAFTVLQMPALDMAAWLLMTRHSPAVLRRSSRPHRRVGPAPTGPRCGAKNSRAGLLDAIHGADVGPLAPRMLRGFGSLVMASQESRLSLQGWPTGRK